MTLCRRVCITPNHPVGLTKEQLQLKSFSFMLMLQLLHLPRTGLLGSHFHSEHPVHHAPQLALSQPAIFLCLRRDADFAMNMLCPANPTHKSQKNRTLSPSASALVKGDAVPNHAIQLRFGLPQVVKPVATVSLTRVQVWICFPYH